MSIVPSSTIAARGNELCFPIASTRQKLLPGSRFSGDKCPLTCRSVRQLMKQLIPLESHKRKDQTRVNPEKLRNRSFPPGRVSASSRERELTEATSATVTTIQHGRDDATVSGRSSLWSDVERIIRDVNGLGPGSSPRDKLKEILKYATQLPRLSKSEKIKENRVPGCTAQVWLTAELKEDGKVYFKADSDAELTRGICAVLVNSLSGVDSQDLLSVTPDEIGVMVEEFSKSTTWFTLITSMQKRVKSLLDMKSSEKRFVPFPSLIVTADEITAQGAFAEAQVQYLTPDSTAVRELVDVLKEKNIGVVAHFYMDPEVQGVLVGAKKEWPHIHISDSLVMAEHAVKMADAGCKHVAVLGVDFMSENVRAILDKYGHQKVRVYRMSSDEIGCSLAEAAQSAGYIEYLQSAANTPKSLHVIYINTSLGTKAQAQALVPTITCTSSNVLQTILQAFAQVPDLTVWYGPDSYMGANLAEILVQLMSMTDEEIAKVHPAHNRKSVADVLARLQYYRDGTCIVHDLFGKEVVDKLRENYTDAFQTAHLEVPGEMFTLAMDARAQGRGAVGSTQNILDFIVLKVREVLDRGVDAAPKFVLGTEAGMITSIVEAVRKLLVNDRLKKGASAANVGVEIIFPVSSDAITPLEAPSSSSPTLTPALSVLQTSGMRIVPGVTSGEGCSVNGGCASCVFMKMNRLDRLLRICRLVGTPGESLLGAHEPRKFDTLIAGQNVAELGCEPILNMRHFQQTKRMSDKLVEDIIMHGCGASLSS
ncbi:unnamed protein product [Calypogeia fissa]